MPGLFISNMLKENCDLYKMSRVTRIATNANNPEKEQESIYERRRQKEKKVAGELWEKKGGQNKQALKSGDH